VDPSASAIADDRDAAATNSDQRSAEHTSREESRPAESKKSYEESRPVESRKSYEESPAVVSGRSSRPLAIGAVLAGALLLTIATAMWLRSNHNVESSPPSPSVSPSPATTAASPPSVPIAPDAAKEAGTDRGGSARGAGPETGVPPSAPSAGRSARESSSLPTAADEKASSPKPPLVVTAQLCKDFSTGGSDWHCVVSTSPVGQGRLVFYTRLKSPTATTIQHRWYRDDRLRQKVELPIRANTTDGYRTYSRQTVDNRGAGNWRVELRTKDGVLLHEERFVVH
jgi:Protein of unknown function (DUF2914)